MKKIIIYLLIISLSIYSSWGCSSTKTIKSIDDKYAEMDYTDEMIFYTSKENLFNAIFTVMEKRSFDIYESNVETGIIMGDMEKSNLLPEEINEIKTTSFSEVCLNILGVILIVLLFLVIINNPELFDIEDEEEYYEDEDYYYEDIYASTSSSTPNYFILNLMVKIDSIDSNKMKCKIELYRYYMNFNSILDEGIIKNRVYNHKFFNEVLKEL